MNAIAVKSRDMGASAPLFAPGAEDVPLVAHVIHRLAMGGLENGLVNLVNHMPPERFRHAIISLTDHTDFIDRIRRPDVPVFCLGKREGKDWGAYRRLYGLLRGLRPDILHTRTMAALDVQAYGALAGVRARVHGEHGQASSFMNGRGLRQRLYRHMFRPLVDHYTAVNRELADYLVSDVGVPRERVTPIYNGVDTVRFYPRGGCRPPLGPPGFADESSVIVGTVGRVQPVKNQECLVRAFLNLVDSSAALRERLRLVLVGDGPLLAGLRRTLDEAGAASLAWLPGGQPDVPELMRAMDVFVLPSIAEGTSNTILEAMASGLPVIATHVGGNSDLVVDGRTGRLIPPNDSGAIAAAIRWYAEDRGRRTEHGREGRRAAEERFSLKRMIEGYMEVYDATLRLKAVR